MQERNGLKHSALFLVGATLVLLLGTLTLGWLLYEKKKSSTEETTQGASQKGDEFLRKEYTTLLEKTKAKREIVAAHIVRGDIDTVRLLETIENTATRFGLPITETVNIEKAGTSTSALVVSVETKGEFQSVMGFLTSLEGLPYEMFFRTTTIRRSSEVSQKDAQWSLVTSFLIKSFIP